MKVTFNYGIGAFSGTVKDGTYMPSKRRTFSIMRQWVDPARTAQNTEIGAVGSNLGILWHGANSDYKLEVKAYAELYYQNQESGDMADPATSGFALFTKALWAWQDANPSTVDLKTVNGEDILTIGEDVINIAACVTNGFLPAVPGWEAFDANMYRT